MEVQTVKCFLAVCRHGRTRIQVLPFVIPGSMPYLLWLDLALSCLGRIAEGTGERALRKEGVR